MISKPVKSGRTVLGTALQLCFLVALGVVAWDGYNYSHKGCSEILKTCPAPPASK